MAHHTVKSGYKKFQERLNLFPLGVPPTETLYKILEILVSEEEARLLALLPIKPFTVETASKNWQMNLKEAQKQLEILVGRAVLIDVEINGKTSYVIPPPMAGFFEFSFMRMRGDIDQHLLGQLFYQYMNEEDEFITELFSKETQLGRIFVDEDVLSYSDKDLLVLDFERSTEVIKTASHIGVGMCYCRHKMEHVGKACNAPMDICMTFNNTAASLIKSGYARQIEESECLDLLEQAKEHNLVQFGENVQRSVNFICNCCGCCCEALVAARKFGLEQPIHTTNFLPEVKRDNCTGCGKCALVCPLKAMTMVSSNDLHGPKQKVAKLDERVCLGCGVCLRACPRQAIGLVTREQRVITPVDGVHKTVLMAIERGKLQNLIFDNQVLQSHRMMAAVLGSILKLPPIKQIMASEQVKSKYIVNLIERRSNKNLK